MDELNFIVRGLGFLCPRGEEEIKAAGTKYDQTKVRGSVHSL